MGAWQRGVGEEYAALGEAVEVGGGSLEMTLEATDPVIQVVDREQKDIGLALGFSKKSSRYKTGENEVGFHFI